MPPPVTPAAGLGGAGAYDPSPFSAPSHQSSAMQKMNSKKKKAEDSGEWRARRGFHEPKPKWACGRRG